MNAIIKNMLFASIINTSYVLIIVKIFIEKILHYMNRVPLERDEFSAAADWQKYNYSQMNNIYLKEWGGLLNHLFILFFFWFFF